MRLAVGVFIMFSTLTLFGQQSLIDDLRDNLAVLEDGEDLRLDYRFEGKRGPFHHGNIVFSLNEDEIAYVSEPFDRMHQPGLIQVGVYSPQDLDNHLYELRMRPSSRIAGDVIRYQLSIGNKELVAGVDRIRQWHFIRLFEPFAAVFPLTSKNLKPRVGKDAFIY